MTQKEAATIIAQEIKHIEEALDRGCGVFNQEGPSVHEFLQAQRIALKALEKPIDAAFARIFESAGMKGEPHE